MTYIKIREIYFMVSLFIQGHFKTTGKSFNIREFLAEKETHNLSQLYRQMREEDSLRYLKFRDKNGNDERFLLVMRILKELLIDRGDDPSVIDPKFLEAEKW